jgi:hypothetical protein
MKITIVILASVPERNPSFYLNVYGDFDLEWNGKGEIVYRGHNIRGTNIVDLLKHCVMPYHPDTGPELRGGGVTPQQKFYSKLQSADKNIFDE